MRLIFQLCSVFFCLVSLQAFATNVPLQDFYREVWTTRDGLPHNTVNSIQQTDDGYLWFAGWEGAARFDGREFELFQRSQLSQLADSGILVLQKRADGALVLGGSRGGLVQLQQEKSSLLPSVKSQANDILEDQFSTLWVSTEGSGLFRISADGQISQYSVETQLRTNIANQLHQTEDGKIWIATANGLFWFDPALATPRFNAVSFFAGMNVYALAGRKSSELLVGTDQGAFVHKKQQFQLLSPALNKMSVSRFLIDGDGSVWVGTFDKGLYRFGEFGIENLNVASGLPNNRVLSLFQDRENSIWVGTNGGLFRLRGTPFRTLTSSSGLADNYVRAVFQHEDGSVWIGSSAGLDRYADGAITRLQVKTPLKINSYRAIGAGADGDVWVGTYADGAILFRNQQELTRYNRQSGMGSDMVLAIHQTANGQVFFGTSAGLSVLTNGVIRNYHIKDGLPGEFVGVIRADLQGRLWIGTGHGAVIWQEENMEVIDLSSLNGPQQIFDFFLDDSNQQSWMATDRGIVRYDWRSKSLQLLGPEQGLPVEKIFSILSEDGNYFWISSNHGITRILRSEIDKVFTGELARLTRVEHFGAREGMQDAQCNGGSTPSASRHIDGSFWFATGHGIARIHPDDLTTNQFETPPVVIQQVTVDGREVSAIQPTLPAKTRRIKFDYAGLSYLMPTRLQYRTKLEGFDPDWVERGTLFTAEYTNLPAGEYRFLVSATYPDGAWSVQPAEFRFDIEQPTWRRIELLVGVIVFFVLLIGLLYQWRVRHLNKNALQLQNQVEVKNHALAEQEVQLAKLEQSHQQLVEQIKMQSDTMVKVDDLTALPSQTALIEQLTLESIQARTLQQVLSLILVDIDEFALLNARWNKRVGDQVIIRVADALRLFLRDMDFLARVGPQKFAILLPDTTLEPAIDLAEQLRLIIAQIHCDDIAENITLSASLGVASQLGCGKAEPLLLQAEAMLSQAKALGRNRVCP